jgi:predicted component of type VI protein secretion system
VHRDCHVQHDRAFYSAPFSLVGKTLWLRATDTVVALHEDYRHVYTHLRAQHPGQRLTLPEHLPPAARQFFERDRRWCATQAHAVGPHCTALIERLLGDRVAERLRAAQGVLAMAARYGPARLEAACQRALAHDSPHYRTVKTILASGADRQPLLDDYTPDTPAAYGRARFTRSAADLFAADNYADSTVH